MLDLLAGGVGEAEGGQQLLGATAGRGLVVAPQASQQHQVLRPCQVLIDRGVLAGEADQTAHGVGIGADVVAEHARLAGVGRQQRGEDADGGGLAGAVGSEDPVHRPCGDGQVQPVDGAGLAERLGEAPGLDGGVRSGVHECSCRVSSWWRRALLREEGRR